MKKIVTRYIGIAVLFVGNVMLWGQKGNTETLSHGVDIKIAAAKNPVKVGDGLSIQMVVANQSKKLLMLEFMRGVSTFRIHVRDIRGNDLKETEVGCRRHQSDACASNNPNGIIGDMQYFVLGAGKESESKLDVSEEFIIDEPGTYTVDVTEDDFKFADMPSDGNLLQYQKKTEQVGNIRSNVITIQVLPR